jgi:hypothetical protein
MATPLAIEQIKTSLHAKFDNMIDLSDVRSPEQAEPNFLTRALAAFCITCLTGAEPRAATAAITDGYDDGGIDAIFTHLPEKTIYFVQSKWSGNGADTISEGATLTFLNGVDRLISAKFNPFNEKIRRRATEIRSNLLARSDMRIVLALAFTSSNPLSSHVNSLMDDYLAKQNNVGDREVFARETFDIPMMYRYLSQGSKINAQIALSEWGTVEHPYRAYYGMMTVQDIGRWADFGKPLLARNIRFYTGSTDVNDALHETLQTDPVNFWYFNNGITILCDKVVKTHHNANNRDYGVFDCEGMSVVNGGQTVGVIMERAKRDPSGFAELKSRVSVRIISLQNCPHGFDHAVARATNTQNRIQPLNYVVFDTNQDRLAVEMESLNKRYAFKSGDRIPKGDEGCGIEEAAVALACKEHEVSYAVLAKREVGRLWASTDKDPYTALFNPQLSATHLWRAVTILREVEITLKKIDTSTYSRGELVAIHGNRFIQHMVFQDPSVIEFRNPKVDLEDFRSSSARITPGVFEKLTRLVNELYQDNYLANLFKNTQKCERLAAEMVKPDDSVEPFRLRP